MNERDFGGNGIGYGWWVYLGHKRSDRARRLGENVYVQCTRPQITISRPIARYCFDFTA